MEVPQQTILRIRTDTETDTETATETDTKTNRHIIRWTNKKD